MVDHNLDVAAAIVSVVILWVVILLTVREKM